MQALLPDGLVPDLYEGKAWVSFTPFVMENARALGALRLPREATFPETNLRTYVRGPDGKDGLWFFSIVVTNTVMALLGRTAGVPYDLGTAHVDSGGESVLYAGAHRGGRPSYRMRLLPGAPFAPSPREVWLTGRWRAYTRRLDTLWETPVVHEPWPLREAHLEDFEEGWSIAAGLPSRGLTPPLVHYSDGVRNVRLGAPRPVRADRVTSR